MEAVGEALVEEAVVEEAGVWVYQEPLVVMEGLVALEELEALVVG